MQSISDDKNIQLLGSFALGNHFYVITARQRNWGKVMFSRVSVSHSVHSGVGISDPVSFQGVGISGTRSPSGKGMCLGMVHVQGVCPVGGHETWNTIGYGWQAASTHPTGMFSC